jgi:hypothetical protein
MSVLWVGTTGSVGGCGSNSPATAFAGMVRQRTLAHA